MIITAKCPNCGYAENLPDEYVGNAIECVSCGIPFVVGEVRISRRLLFSEEPNVACPYCKEMITLPKDAANRNVRCWNCDKKFFVSVKMPQMAAPILNKAQPVNDFASSKKANWKQVEKPTVWLSTKAIFLIIAVIICVATGLPAFIFIFREQTGVGSSLVNVFYDDDTCSVEYTRAMLLNDYDKAEKWARRMRVDENKKIALKGIEEAKKLDKLQREVETYLSW